MRICPDCGESCAQAWCGFCERMLAPAGCGFGPCGDPDCYLCTKVPVLAAPVPRCPHEVESGTGKNVHLVLCRFIEGHRPPCRPSTRRVKAPDEDDQGEDAWFR